MIGLVDEYRQFFDSKRDTEFLDGVANLVGVLSGLALAALLHYRVPRASYHVKRWVPPLLVYLILFYGLTFFTSKGTSGEFFKERQKASVISQVVFHSREQDQGMALIRDKYLSKILFIEEEYQKEASELIGYMMQGEEVWHHLWLMKQLDDVKEEQFETILNEIKRTIQNEQLSPRTANIVAKEFAKRHKNQRAQVIKKTILNIEKASD